MVLRTTAQPVDDPHDLCTSPLRTDCPSIAKGNAFTPPTSRPVNALICRVECATAAATMITITPRRVHGSCRLGELVVPGGLIELMW